ncbi:MAG: lipopolysaccharide heptosyltransferase II [Candidatus Methylomirabilales bacterium]
MDIDPQQVRKLLIRGVNWVGDALMTTPALAGIRRTFPHARISLLVKPRVEAVFRYNANVDQILSYESKGRHKGFAGLLALAAALRRERFDLAILLQNAFQAALLARMAGIPHRVGYSAQGRGWLLSRAVPVESKAGRHQVDYYRDLLKGLGWDPGERCLNMPIGPEAEAKAAELIEGAGSPYNAMLFGLNPAATYGPAKRWFPGRFALLADRLVGQWDSYVVLTGTTEDRKVTQEVQRAVTRQDRVIDLSGQTDLQTLGALIRRCRLYVTNDTGSMHVAVAVGTPLVAIFGPTDPVETGPLSSQSRVLRHPVPCSPCHLRECPIDHRCMRGIDIDGVMTAVTELFAI